MIESDMHAFEADATLFTTDGLIDYIDILCHIGDYPEHEITSYTLTQIRDNSSGKRIERNIKV